MLDTNRSEQKGLYYSLKKLDHIRISGYMQPQFQVASAEGAKNYSGGDFLPKANSRFMLRRGRIRFDYAGFTENHKPSVQFVFQFDGTERGVAIRDFWGRVYENRFELFSFTAGMFARPFGYEINLSSGNREAPERGRASQILMRTERDLGAMVSLESRQSPKGILHYLKWDAGFFNGQGLTSPADFDSYKDFITRVSTKSVSLNKSLSVTAGLSLLQGGFVQNNKYVYSSGSVGGEPVFIIDSSISNIGEKAPRQYRGADAQLKWNHNWGATELRFEYWWGTQTATALTTETPPLPLEVPHYIRNFDAAFICFLQNIINTQHQLGIKYDWYDPNTNASGRQIGKVGTNLTPADIKYSTLGFGYINYINKNLKLVLWYDVIKIESTALNGYTNDLEDNIFTCRLQFHF